MTSEFLIDPEAVYDDGAIHLANWLGIRVIVIERRAVDQFRMRLLGARPEFAVAVGHLLADLPLTFMWDNTGDAAEIAWQWAKWLRVWVIYDFDWEMGNGE